MADAKARRKQAPSDGSHDAIQHLESYVDAALSTKERTGLAKADIIDHMTRDALIPARYLYDNEVGTQSWLSLCEDRQYHYFYRSLSFWDATAGPIVAEIAQALGHQFDFVSLGPGDGRKDLELVRAMTDSKLNVIYYPYDVSPRMIARTVREIRKLDKPGRVRAVLAEFDDLSDMKTVFGARKAPTVISLLGNSLGNVPDELAFIRDLRELMKTGDLLLLEVRLTRGDDTGPPEFNRPRAKKFYVSPLEHYLAMTCDENKVKYRREEEGLSKISGTSSTLIYYKSVSFKGVGRRDAMLLCINEYDQEQLMDAIKAKGFACISARVDNSQSFLVCLLRCVASGPGGGVQAVTR